MILIFVVVSPRAVATVCKFLEIERFGEKTILSYFMDLQVTLLAPQAYRELKIVLDMDVVVEEMPGEGVARCLRVVLSVTT